ncbi:DNA cytosine methyltransferase [Mucilaginibacter pedocola]|uniref:Cytosine-specific methyltransferase n=1 Tax=Mucilaginibacter pedocola TaxID=1792845 RepID=A0A1S9PC03_9SPHI|nr:DNA cytosine methyltransferase [Mucilaginibacter pedocola]OOQ58485.1 DNA (cytosine-5-)-methyltransferase [Mucilaginibacter pedocola]
MKLVSFFSGAGGLDLGFKKAGFNTVWANEYDKDIWETFEKNHTHTVLDRRSITDITSDEVPDCDGIIGGPPCQSWSAGGALRGIDDKRGKLFYDFIRILKDKQPLFFLAENVAGMLLERHKFSMENFKNLFGECGYELSVTPVNASDYGVPQDRKRIFFVGYRKDLGMKFKFPEPTTKNASEKKPLHQTIGDLKDTAIPAIKKDFTNGSDCLVPNHEYMTGDFSSIYMSRNRVRGWDDVSFTIQAGGRHAPLHPQAPKMPFVATNVREFAKGSEKLYRRLTVRECARVQTFPDDFILHYKKLTAGYKMIGNAVPVDLAAVIATQIAADLKAVTERKKDTKVA